LDRLWIVAYTDDAFVESDLVQVASQVAGPIVSVQVVDNMSVTKGDLLALIDPRPYDLALALQKQKVAAAEAAVAVKQQAEAVDSARVDRANAAVRLAEVEYRRDRELRSTGDIAQESLDRATDAFQSARDMVAAAQATAAVSARELDAAMAAVATAQAEQAVAQYNLDRTRLTAPVSGYINHLTLRPGDFADIGRPILGIVDSAAWRVIADYKEEIVGDLEPGRRAWVWLDSHPWHLYRATVQGIGRGIARDASPSQLLPYVAPTTDWIRLQRRLPVTLTFDPPLPKHGLYMGADARVLFFR
jgi:multidrug efflux system membrane fusion protein